jgi:hypothetical protein
MPKNSKYSIIKESVLAFIILLSITGCKKDNSLNYPVDLLSLWEFDGYGIKNTCIEPIPDSIHFDLYLGSIYSNGNDFEGETPYRNYWGRFALNGNQINCTDIKVTYILSINDSMDYFSVERKYLKSLLGSHNYTVEENQLTIYLKGDSTLIFHKSQNQVYDQPYGFSAQFNQVNWAGDKETTSFSLYDNYGAIQFNADSIKALPDNYNYSLHYSLVWPQKKGIYLIDNSYGGKLSAYIYSIDHPDGNRFEADSGFVKINRISRGFLSGEFEFRMGKPNNSGKLYINLGKFKSEIMSHTYPDWFKDYN